jgi:hypothetical protein
MRIELHVDRLVLDGLAVSQHQGDAVMLAVQRELARLLTDEATPSTWSAGASVDAIQGTTIRTAGAAGPAALGERIAASVAAGLGERR